MKKSALISFIAVSLYSLLQFFMQVSGNLITNDLHLAFNINELQVGLLTSVYFWTLLFIQMPAGIMLDNYGAKKILIISSLVLCLGCVGFAISHTFAQAVISRMIMGLGAGFGFIGMVFVIAESFPANYFGWMLGLGELIGMIGTALAQYYAPIIILSLGWRALILIVAAAVLISSLLMLLSLTTQSKRQKVTTTFLQQFYQPFLTIIKNKFVWQSGLFGLGAFLILTAFLDIWAVPFFEHVYKFSYLKSAQILTAVLLGIACGGPALGKIADNSKNPKIIMIIATLIVLFAMTTIIALPTQQLLVTLVLLFILGFFSSVYLLAFMLIRLNIDETVRGTAMAFCNTLELFGAVLFQPLIGFLVIRLQNYKYDYQIALSSMSVMIFISFLVLLTIKIKTTAKNSPTMAPVKIN